MAARGELLDQQIRGGGGNPFEWYRPAKPPIEITPFVPDSYLQQIGQNEWVMTRYGMPLPGEHTYGVGNPMPMRVINAPGAKEEARKILEVGRDEEEIISPEDVVDVKRAIRNTRAFIQVWGRKGNRDGVDIPNVSCISTGLTWDRQSPMEQPAREMAQHILGQEATIVWFGPHKFLAFAKGEFDPWELMRRLVDAPREPYKSHFRNVAVAQNGIQDLRINDILDSTRGAGRYFIDYFEGRKNDLDRAFKPDGRFSMQWNYEEQKRGLVTLDPDGKPYPMMKLVYDGYEEDEDMKNLLFAAHEFFTDKTPEDRAVVEVTFDETAVCCGFSVNAQQDTQAWEQDAYTIILSSQFNNNSPGYVTFTYPNGEQYTVCKRCKKKKEDCKCFSKKDSSTS